MKVENILFRGIVITSRGRAWLAGAATGLITRTSIAKCKFRREGVERFFLSVPQADTVITMSR